MEEEELTGAELATALVDKAIVAKDGDIPVHSTPVTMAASFSWEHMHGSRFYRTEINQVVHAWQPRIHEIDNLIESANCTCASWDTSCLIREATSAKINGGGSAKVDPVTAQVDPGSGQWTV